MNDLTLPGRVSDAGPDNPLSPESELRSIIADAAFKLKQAEDAIDPLPAVREVYETLGGLLKVDPWDRQHVAFDLPAIFVRKLAECDMTRQPIGRAELVLNALIATAWQIVEGERTCTKSKS